MAAPLRIRGSSKTGGFRRSRSNLRSGESVDSYVQRLIKLIPAEIVSAYLVGREIAQADNHNYGHEWAAWCLLATVVFRSLMTYERPQAQEHRFFDYFAGVEWPAVLIAAASFSIWVFTLGDSYPAPLPSLEKWQATLLLLLWTPFIPLIYKGSLPADTQSAIVSIPQKGSTGTAVQATPAPDGLAGPEATAPRVPPRLPQRVRRGRIGSEDRRRVADASQSPFNQIALIQAMAHDETTARKAGTAWFLSPTVVVTAGHCVYDPSAFGADGFAGYVLGWPGYNQGGGSARFRADEIHVPSQYANGLDNEFDIAVLLLNSEYEGFGISPTAVAPSGRVMVAGFPSNLGGGTTMFEGFGDVVAIEDGFVFHNTDTSPGQSGAPVLIENGGWRAAGVHIDGAHHSDHLTQEANLAIAFHPEVERWLNQFR